MNPVFHRENQTVLRSFRTFCSISLYVLFLAVILAISVALNNSTIYYRGFSLSLVTSLYQFLGCFQLGLIMLFVPPMTGGSISGERERQTLDLMLVTKMSTLTIIIGKLLSSIIMILLMIAASLPVFALVLFFGGASIFELLAIGLFYLFVGTMIGSFTIFLSSIYKRTVASIVVSYIFIGMLTLGVYVGLVVTNQIMLSSSGMQRVGLGFNTIYGFLSFNPFFGFLSALNTQSGAFPLDALVRSVNFAYVPNPGRYLPIWVTNIIINTILTIVFVLLASYFIHPLRKQPIKRKGKKNEL